MVILAVDLLHLKSSLSLTDNCLFWLSACQPDTEATGKHLPAKLRRAGGSNPVSNFFQAAREK
jgi:hypothetical protein